MKTDVIFRKNKTEDFKGEVFALFPYEISTCFGAVTSYAHVGQHSSADYDHCIQTSVPATEDEYADLKKELEEIGYDLNVRRKINYKKYIKARAKIINLKGI